MRISPGDPVRGSYSWVFKPNVYATMNTDLNPTDLAMVVSVGADAEHPHWAYVITSTGNAGFIWVDNLKRVER